jgi:hypothetical protein
MAIPADVPGSRLLPRHRAGYMAKRLPSRRWAMAGRADVSGSRLLPRHRAGYMAKRLPSRRWAMAGRADVSGSRLLPRYRANHMAKRLPSRPIELPRGGAVLSPDPPTACSAPTIALIAPAIHRTEDPSAMGPTAGISLVGRNRCHVEFSRILRAP